MIIYLDDNVSDSEKKRIEDYFYSVGEIKIEGQFTPPTFIIKKNGKLYFIKRNAAVPSK